MSWDSLEPALPVLAVLGAILVSCTLTTLAAQRRHAIDVYDRVRLSKSMRARYLETMKNHVNTY
jgi:hypothetical protein